MGSAPSTSADRRYRRPPSHVRPETPQLPVESAGHTGRRSGRANTLPAPDAAAQPAPAKTRADCRSRCPPPATPRRQPGRRCPGRRSSPARGAWNSSLRAPPLEKLARARSPQVPRTEGSSGALLCADETDRHCRGSLRRDMLRREWFRRDRRRAGSRRPQRSRVGCRPAAQSHAPGSPPQRSSVRCHPAAQSHAPGSPPQRSRIGCRPAAYSHAPGSPPQRSRIGCRPAARSRAPRLALPPPSAGRRPAAYASRLAGGFQRAGLRPQPPALRSVRPRCTPTG